VPSLHACRSTLEDPPAILFAGNPKKILSLIIDNKIQGFISPFIIFELKEVLRKKFNFSLEILEELEELIKEKFIIVYPKKTINLIKEVLADNRILECAIEAKADFLISGDTKHILKLKKTNKTKIVSANEFLKHFNKSK
jgi:conserved hypothetical protein TIGR00305